MNWALGALLLFLLLCSAFGEDDMPNGIIPPRNITSPGFIIAESDGGLSNRLRTLAAYMYVGQLRYEGASCIFVWDVNDACPGHFLELFDPIDSVVFVTNTSKILFEPHAKVIFQNSLAVFGWIMQMYGIPRNRFGHPSWHQIEVKMYSQFMPRRSIMTKVMDYVQAHNICNSSAFHLRATDLARILAKNRKPVNIGAFQYFVATRPEGESVFMMTDSPEQQRAFLHQFGPQKLLVYRMIPDVSQQIAVSSLAREGNAVGSNLTGNHSLPDEHRFTTLEHTLIDVLIAAHAKEFKSAMFSSLSDLVRMYSFIGKKKWGWCT